MHKLPLVSVVITNFNYQRFVRQAITSVRNQSYDKLECIVIDDCSTDQSFETILACLDELQDPRFRALRLGRNSGQMAAIKAGLENSRGHFVVLLDADDQLSSPFIETHLAVHLNKSHSASLTASDTLQMDGDDVLIEGTFHSIWKPRFIGEEKHFNMIAPASIPVLGGEGLHYGASGATDACVFVDSWFKQWHVVAMSSLMFRREVLNLVIPQEPSGLRICADYYLVLFAHLIGGTICIPNALSYFRLHTANTFSSNGVMGGKHRPGFFTPARALEIEESMKRHLLENRSRFERAIGEDRVSEILGAITPAVRKTRNPAVVFLLRRLAELLSTSGKAFKAPVLRRLGERVWNLSYA